MPITIPSAQFPYNHLVVHVYEHRQTILQWPSSVPGNISKHAQLISTDKQATQLGDTRTEVLQSQAARIKVLLTYSSSIHPTLCQRADLYNSAYHAACMYTQNNGVTASL